MWGFAKAPDNNSETMDNTKIIIHFLTQLSIAFFRLNFSLSKFHGSRNS
jgi:hypothetical protein